MHWRRKWQPTPVFLPGESQGGEAWLAAVYGIAQSRIRLKWRSSSSQVYAPISNTEEAEVERFYEDLQDLLELTPKRDVLFIIGDWNAKVESQETPGVTGKYGLGVQNKAGQRLIELCQEIPFVIANTLFQQHNRRLYTWTSPDDWYWNQIDYMFCSQREALCCCCF